MQALKAVPAFRLPRRAWILTSDRLARPRTWTWHSIEVRVSSGGGLGASGSLSREPASFPGPGSSSQPLLSPASYLHCQCLENVILNGQG